MSEGYYSVSPNGSDVQTRPDGSHASKGKEQFQTLKQSNMRSSSMLALNAIASTDLPQAPRGDARAEPGATSQAQSRTGSGASTAASSVETVIFRGRAKSNTETMSTNTMEDKETRDELTALSKVPRATVLPRSTSVYALNSQQQQQQQQRLGISHPILQQEQRPFQDRGRQPPYLPHSAALPSYPAHPYPSSYSSHHQGEIPPHPPPHYHRSASSDAGFPCISCGAYFTPQRDERGVAQNSYCYSCVAQQPLRRLRLPGAIPISPSKRGSWHAGADYPASPSSSSSSYLHAASAAAAENDATGAANYPSAYPTYSAPATNVPPYSTLYSYRPVPPNYHIASDPSPSSVAPQSSSSSSSAADPSKFDSLRRTAGSIIKEKDAVIDKQRHQIQQLEQLARQAQHQSTELAEKQLHRYPSYDPHSLQQQSKDLDVKMQEFQYETASVRAQLTEAASASKMEFDDLTRKLAEAELDADRNKFAFQEERSQNEQRIADVGKKLTDKQGDYDELKLKYKTKEKELSRAKKNLSNIETYLARLPTPQEVEERETRLEELEEALRRMEEKTRELEGEVTEAKGEAEAKAAVIQSLEQAEDEWKTKLDDSNRERDKYRDLLRSLRGGGGGGGGGGDSDSGVSVEDMEDEIQRLKSDAERLKKLVETQQKRHKTQQRELKMEQQDLEDQLKKEQEKVLSLETRLKQRDAEVDRLRDRVSDDDAIKESLRERVAQLTDELADASAGGEEAALKEKMQQRLGVELAAAFAELQGLVQICNDEVDGKDPNMSVLLGLRRSEDGADGDEAGAVDATTRLAQAKALRKEVDRLRTLVSNKIAENLGDNLDCTQQ